MKDNIVKIVNMRSPDYSIDVNPFLEHGTQIKTKNKTVRTKAAPQELMNPETGELVAMSLIHVIEEKDEEHFVKVFADGVKASFELSRSGGKVFQAVLGEYQKEKMTGGFADTITLWWFGNGLNGKEIGMSERTFQRGLKELVEKGFLSHRVPNQFWVNPALFFKGDRVAFMKEYRLQKPKKQIAPNEDIEIPYYDDLIDDLRN